mgnify:CR=1 FL=1
MVVYSWLRIWLDVFAFNTTKEEHQGKEEIGSTTALSAEKMLGKDKK